MTARIRTRSRFRPMALARHWGSYLNGRRRLHGRLIRRMADHLVQSTTPAVLARPPRRRLKQGLPPSSPLSPSLLTFCLDPGHPSVTDLSSGRKLNGPKHIYS